MPESSAEPLPRVPLAYLVGGDPDAEPDAVQCEQLLLATLIAHGWKGRTREPTLRAWHFSEPIHAGLFAALSFGDRTRVGSGHRAPAEYVDGLVSIARDADEVSALERVVIGNWLRLEVGRLARTLACESEAKRLDGYELVELATSRMDLLRVV